MSERHETSHQVVVRHGNGHGGHGSTEVWEKDRAGRTTKEGYSRVVGRDRYNYWGRRAGRAGGRRG